MLAALGAVSGEPRIGVPQSGGFSAFQELGLVTDAAIVGDSVQSVLPRPARPGHAPGPAPPPHPGAGRGPDRPRPSDLHERQQQLGGVAPRGGRETELPS